MATVALPVPGGDLVSTGAEPAMTAEPDPWVEPGPADAPVVPLFDDDGVLILLERLEDDEPA
jgi:hypothetical protein